MTYVKSLCAQTAYRWHP